MIKKEKEGYIVRSESGKKLGGPYPSRAKAQERLNQVEMFKHMEKKGKKDGSRIG